MTCVMCTHTHVHTIDWRIWFTNHHRKQQSSIVSFDSDGKTSFVGCTDGSITVLQHCDTPEKGFEQVCDSFDFARWCYISSGIVVGDDTFCTTTSEQCNHFHSQPLFFQVMSIQAFDLPSKISCLQVSSDGSTLLCGSTKGILKIWAVIKNEDI